MNTKRLPYTSSIGRRPRAVIKFLTMALVFVLLLSGREAASKVVDRVVAIINEDIITLSELNAASALSSNGVKIAENRRIKKDRVFMTKMLEGLIEEKLIKQASDRAGIEISEKEIDNAVDEIKRQNNFTKDQLMVALANSGLTYSEYRERLKEQIRVVKFMNTRFRARVSIQPEEIEDYYRQHIEEFFGPASYRIESIFVNGSDEKTQKLKLKYIKEGLEKGTDFSELARQYSDGPAASSGGDLGYLTADEIDPVLKKIVLNLKVGETSPLIEKPDGVHIIRLSDYRPGEPAPFEQVRGRIYEKLFNEAVDEKVQSWLKGVKKISHIEIRL
ncbi:MAG: peptidylprolyl isomerase [Thermodesulfobacteriota bacterium]|nr:MAG: peptidylprolyl isomerase [Thermodesulfobacteriota bacterium]